MMKITVGKKDVSRRFARRSSMCFVAAVVVAVITFSNRVSNAEVIADYSFDGDLTATTGQPPLQVVGYPGVGAAPGITFQNDTIGGQPATVAHLTQGTALVVRHGAPANGGGTYLNQYTLIMDVKFPAVGDWISLYQTNAAFDDTTGAFDLSTSNDGDWFVNPAAQIGISGNYGGTVSQDTWHRLALTVDGGAFNFTSYIDGVQVQQNAGGAPDVDGRFSLYNTTNPDPYDWFLLFADDTADAAEMGEVVINHFQFRDWALSGEEIAALGGPSAAGPFVPEPSCLLLLLLGVCGLRTVRSRGL
jgi:hypothetical protein